jgi:hypothetical protein
MRVRTTDNLIGMRLHRNEWSYGQWAAYPNLNYYYKKFLEILGYDNLFFTEGVSGGIKNICEVLKPSKISYDSDFSLYPIYETIFKGKGPSVQFICNPKTKINNEYDHVVIDDVYQHFHNHDWDVFLPNVTILRSFSKSFGLAGLRIGYMTGELTDQISLYRGGYEANTFSLNVALKTLMDKDRVLKYVDRCKISLDYMNNYDFYTYNGYTNYVNCKYDFTEKLYQHGYLVKKNDTGMRITLAPIEIIQPMNELILKWI